MACHRGVVQFSEIAGGFPHVLSEIYGEPLTVVGVDRPPPVSHADQPWLAVKYGPADTDDLHGVTPVTVTTTDRVVDLIVKVNPVHGIGETLIPWICDTFGVELPAPYATFHSAREVVATGARESNVYDLSVTMPELMALLPPYFGTITAHGERALLLGDVTPLAGLDAGGAVAHWTSPHVDAALRAIGAVHAASTPVADGLAWLPPRTDATTFAGDAELWQALLADATRRFPDIVTPEVAASRARLIETASDWYRAKEPMPTVLAHNGFNQRNVGFDADDRVVALDWELARLDSPQRDVAELLTFLLPPDVSYETLDHHATQHRESLGANGLVIAEADYRAALAADLRSEAVERVGMQLLFAAAFDLPYIPRINATVQRLVDLTEPWLA